MAEDRLFRRTQELEAMVSIATVLAGLEPFEVKAGKMLVEMKTLSASDLAVPRWPAADESGLRAVADSGLGKLRAVASELGVLVENARLREETEQHLTELHAAHEPLQNLSRRLLEAQKWNAGISPVSCTTRSASFSPRGNCSWISPHGRRLT